MEEYIGTIKMFAFNFTPQYFESCSGQLLSIQQNTALFSLIGTVYGGNGNTTFALPNLQGRVPLGAGQSTWGSNYQLGQFGGVETVTLLISNLPAHTHNATGVTATLKASNTNANQSSASGHVPATAGTPDPPRNFNVVNAYSDQAPNVSLANTTIEVGGTVSPTGGNMPINNMMPFLAVNFCICVQGLFPTRQ